MRRLCLFLSQVQSRPQAGLNSCDCLLREASHPPHQFGPIKSGHLMAQSNGTFQQSPLTGLNLNGCRTPACLDRRCGEWNNDDRTPPRCLIESIIGDHNNRPHPMLLRARAGMQAGPPYLASPQLRRRFRGMARCSIAASSRSGSRSSLVPATFEA